jgi:hypothetical protein
MPDWRIAPPNVRRARPAAISATRRPDAADRAPQPLRQGDRDEVEGRQLGKAAAARDRGVEQARAIEMRRPRRARQHRFRPRPAGTPRRRQDYVCFRSRPAPSGRTMCPEVCRRRESSAVNRPPRPMAVNWTRVGRPAPFVPHHVGRFADNLVAQPGQQFGCDLVGHRAARHKWPTSFPGPAMRSCSS